MNEIFRGISAWVILAVSLTSLDSHFLPAANAQQSGKVAASGEEAVVNAQIKALNKALSSGNAKDVSSLWEPDGSYTDETGASCSGQDAIEKRFTDVFGNMGKVLVQLIPQRFRMLATNVASSEGLVVPQGGSAPDTRYSMVMVKKDGKWLIASAVETPFMGATSGHPLSTLDWLTGEWTAENNGASVKMKADWINNGHFILCKYDITRPGQENSVESQVIGWDPQNEEITSWSFGSSGEFGHGHWRRKGKEWIVESCGVAPDGKPVRAVNIISLTDPNHFAWQSIDRTAGGIALGDTEPLTINRVNK